MAFRKNSAKSSWLIPSAQAGGPWSSVRPAHRFAGAQNAQHVYTCRTILGASKHGSRLQGESGSKSPGQKRHGVNTLRITLDQIKGGKQSQQNPCWTGRELQSGADFGLTRRMPGQPFEQMQPGRRRGKSFNGMHALSKVEEPRRVRDGL